MTSSTVELPRPSDMSTRLGIRFLLNATAPSLRRSVLLNGNALVHRFSVEELSPNGEEDSEPRRTVYNRHSSPGTRDSGNRLKGS